MNAKFSECSADLKPLVWVQGGTFGYTETFKLYRTPLLHHSLEYNRKSAINNTCKDCEKTNKDGFQRAERERNPIRD